MASTNSNQWMPTAGGILGIISGAFCIFSGLYFFLMSVFFQIIFRDISSSINDIEGEVIFPEISSLFTVIYCVIGAVMLILGIVAIIGGIYAIRRRKWGLALAGSICGTLGCMIPGVVSLVFVAMSQKEFTAQTISTEYQGLAPPQA